MEREELGYKNGNKFNNKFIKFIIIFLPKFLSFFRNLEKFNKFRTCHVLYMHINLVGLGIMFIQYNRADFDKHHIIVYIISADFAGFAVNR